MSLAPRPPAQPDPAKLRGEWRSFLVGSLVVLFVALFAMALIFVQALDPLLAKLGPSGKLTLAQAQAAVHTLLATHPPFTVFLVWIAGAAGLFVLNVRFSRLLGRPRAAVGRSLWLAATLLNSFLFAYVVPELLMLVLFARWVRGALREGSVR